MPHPEFHMIGTQDWTLLLRPCVDCGQVTGCFCDWCYAKARLPKEPWEDAQKTPLCTACDEKVHACHFCRGMQWCTPPPWR